MQLPYCKTSICNVKNRLVQGVLYYTFFSELLLKRAGFVRSIELNEVLVLGFNNKYIHSTILHYVKQELPIKDMKEQKNASIVIVRDSFINTASIIRFTRQYYCW